MIIRISTEGQYEVADDDVAELNEFDNAAVAACNTQDEESFQAAFSNLLGMIRTKGHPIAEDDLRGSDLILPPPDVTLAEAATEFTGEGLIPG